MSEYFEFDNDNRASFRKKVTADNKNKPHVVIGEEIFVDISREQNGTHGDIGVTRKDKRVLPEME